STNHCPFSFSSSNSLDRSTPAQQYEVTRRGCPKKMSSLITCSDLISPGLPRGSASHHPERRATAPPRLRSMGRASRDWLGHSADVCQAICGAQPGGGTPVGTADCRRRCPKRSLGLSHFGPLADRNRAKNRSSLRRASRC